ncbi:MAG: tetratricopeptide repeat protein [Gammaproteobacteria bacterium]|nr:MAG: tetratricopeptide repeat protein [Gammaproteobacteria bacterium]
MQKLLQLKWPLFSQHLYISLLILVCLGVYCKGLNGPFLLDDKINIPQTRTSDLSLSSLKYAADSNASGMLGRPVSAVSFAISWQFSGSEDGAYYFKLHNLLIHCCCGILIYLIASQLQIFTEQNSKKRYWAVPFFIAGFWLLHPIQVSTVLYVVQRMTQLSVLFSLLFILSFMLGRKQLERKVWQGCVILFVFAPAFLLLGLFSKESAALSIILVAIIEIFIFRMRCTEGRAKKAHAFFCILIIIIPLISGCIYFLANSTSLLNYNIRNYSMLDRIYTQVHVLLFYLRMIFIPDISVMSLFHDDFPIQRQFHFSTFIMVSGMVTSLVLAWIIRKKRPLLALGVFWFFSCHLMESTIFPLEMVFEHRNYLAVVGAAMILTSMLVERKRILDSLKVMIVIAVLICLAVTTAIRVSSWSDKKVLISQAIKSHPNSARVQNNYANIMIKEGRLEEAKTYLLRAMQLTPEDLGPGLHMLLIDCNLGNAVTDVFFHELANRVKDRQISPYAALGFETLIDKVHNGECLGTVSFSQVKDLLLYGIEGENREFGSVYVYLARLEAYSGNYESAMNNFVKATDFESGTRKLNVLFNKIQIQFAFKRFKDAKDTYSEIYENKKDYDNAYLLAKIDRYYSYHQKFGIRK